VLLVLLPAGARQLTPWSWAIAGFSLLVTIGTVIFATMLSVHTGSSVPAHTKLVIV